MAVLLLAGCDGCDSVPSSTPGVAWGLAEHRAETISNLTYDLALTIPAARTAPITGRITARFERARNAGPLVLDFAAPADRVISVRVDERRAAYEASSGHIVLPASALNDGPNAVTIEFIAGDAALNRNDDFLYTLFVPDRAHHTLPLFDQPNLKARVRLTLHVPEGWKAVANGPLDQATPAAKSQPGTTFRFAETQPIPTYLLAFAAGRFEAETAERDGRTMTMYHREPNPEKLARNRDALFDLHATALAWLEEYTGIPYPFAKFDFVLIPSFQYGGMEHPGAILYRQASLLLDESATQSQHLGRASLIAHETAHMWFGDLVTMNWFDDVWTKEVFANFMAAKIVNPSFPEVNHDLRFLLAHYPAAYSIDRTDGANAIRQPLDNLQEAGTLYGAIIYQKAPIVMKHLENLVGQAAFREGMREYLDAFRYGNATWPDLIAILDARTDADLAAWSAVWVETAGRPVITTELQKDANGRITRLALTQTDPQKTETERTGRVWPQRMMLLLGYPNRTFVYRPTVLDAPVVSFDSLRGVEAPAFILPSGRGVGYGRFVLDAGSRDYLLANAPGLGDPVVRGAVWVTLWEAMLYGEIPPARFFTRLQAALDAETDELLLQELLDYLTETYTRFLPTAERTARAAELEAFLWGKIRTAPTTSRKAAFFNAYRDVVRTDAGVERLRAVWREETMIRGLPFAERDFTAMALELAVHWPEDAETILTAQSQRITNPDRRARFSFIRPALSDEAAVRDAFFEGLNDPANRAQEPWVLDAVRYLHHPLRAAEAEKYIRPSLDLVLELQQTGDIFFPKRWLDATLGGHASPEAAAQVRAFLAELPPGFPPRLRGKVLQSADGLFRAAALSNGQTPVPTPASAPRSD